MSMHSRALAGVALMTTIVGTSYASAAERSQTSTEVAATQLPVADGPPYPMAAYFVAFLTRGPKWTPDVTPQTEKIQAAHMENIKKMAEAGALVGAGPFGDNGVLRGIFIFKVKSLEEARALTSGDPAVQAGRLAMDVHPWMGPKGVGDPYKERMAADPKSPPRMRTYQFAILKKGPAAEKERPRELMRYHLGHITKLTRDGAMLAAGPFQDGGDYQGLEFYATDSADEARAMAEQDPAVKAGVFIVEMHPLYMDEGVLPPPATMPEPPR